MFVVCHMLISLDGKIDGDFFGMPQTAPALKAYGELRGFYGCTATLYGTVTMLGGYADGPVSQLPVATQPLSGDDHVEAEGRAMGNFIVSLDPKGELAFSSSTLAKKGRPAAHIVEVLTQQASPAYLSYLRQQGISYIFAGKEQLDCALLPQKLHALFGIDRLMVAGGGATNWSFLQENLINEVSLVVAPVVDGGNALSSFARPHFLPPHMPMALSMLEAKPLDGGTLWLRYAAKQADLD